MTNRANREFVINNLTNIILLCYPYSATDAPVRFERIAKLANEAQSMAQALVLKPMGRVIK